MPQLAFRRHVTFIRGASVSEQKLGYAHFYYVTYLFGAYSDALLSRKIENERR